MNDDLISRRALLTEYNDFKDMDCPSGHTVTADYMIELAEAAPAVDAEVVRHGRWELIARTYAEHGLYRHTTSELYRCSECGLRAAKKYPYCHCGAKMDAEVQDG